MPLISLDTKADWDSFYAIGAEPWGHPGTREEVTLNYHRSVLLPIVRNHAKNLAVAMGLVRTDRLIIVGCGFGWILEAFEQLAVQAVGTQVSSYIQGFKFENEDDDITAAINAVGLALNTIDGLLIYTHHRGNGESRAKKGADVMDEALDTTASQNAVKNAAGGPNAIILSYDGWINTLTDAEATDLSAGMHGTEPRRVYHHVYHNFGNDKTLTEWKNLLPNDFFIEHGTWIVR